MYSTHAVAVYWNCSLQARRSFARWNLSFAAWQPSCPGAGVGSVTVADTGQTVAVVVEEKRRVRVDLLSCNWVRTPCTVYARGETSLRRTHRGAVTLAIADLARALVHLCLKFGQVRVVFSFVVTVAAGRLCSLTNGKSHENQTCQNLQKH